MSVERRLSRLQRLEGFHRWDNSRLLHPLRQPPLFSAPPTSISHLYSLYLPLFPPLPPQTVPPRPQRRIPLDPCPYYGPCGPRRRHRPRRHHTPVPSCCGSRGALACTMLAAAGGTPAHRQEVHVGRGDRSVGERRLISGACKTTTLIRTDSAA